MSNRSRISLITVVMLMGCMPEVIDNSGEDDVVSESLPNDSLNAGGLGLELTFPFSSDSGCVLTRAYCAAEGPWRTDVGSDGTDFCSHHATARYNDAYALDFACAAGTTVVAAESGIVLSVRYDETNWGHHVLIDHGDSLHSLYGHLNLVFVHVGQKVRQGQALGSMGSTGYSTGPHVHFSLMRWDEVRGSYDAVTPEPMSGHVEFHDSGRRYYGVMSEYANLPVGTLIKGRETPEIYLVCGDMRICHIEDWDAFATRRYFHDGRDPLAQIVVVSDETLRCYALGEPIQGISMRALVRCAGNDYLYIEEEGVSVRRKVPFSRDEQSYWYDVLLRSWGFSRTEWRDGSYAECHARLGGDLVLRDGTLIELASDNDFYVVTADATENEARGGDGHGYVRRIHREEDGVPYMPLLYRTYNNVLIVPDDAVFTMTSGAIHGKSLFGSETASACRFGPGFGGGSDDELLGTDGEGSAPENPSEDPPHTLRCTQMSSGLRVSVTGPLLDALIESPLRPAALQYGSDTEGWSVPYIAGSKASVEWHGGDLYVLDLPLGADRFNLYVVDSASPSTDSWFDLDASDGNGVPWQVVGSCRREGTVIVRGGTIDNGGGNPVPDEPTDHDRPSETLSEHSVLCTRTETSLEVRIRGPFMDALHGGTVSDPAAIQYGSNVPYMWDLPYGYEAERTMVPWEDDEAVYILTLPGDVNGINFFIADRGGGGRWFDLDTLDGNGVQWTVTGDCTLEGTLIMPRGP